MVTEYKHVYIPVNKYACLSAYKTACSILGMEYGERLKAARRHARITQQQLADRMDNVVTQAAISYLENSDATGSEYTVQFALACGVSPAWLASEQGDMLEIAYTVHDPDLIRAVKAMEPMGSETRYEIIRQIDFLSSFIGHQPDEKPQQIEPTAPPLALPPPESAPKRPASAVSGGPPKLQKKHIRRKKTS